MRAAILAGLGLTWQVTAAHADVELKNDGFESGGMALAQGGFVMGEIAASRFVAPDAGRTLLRVQLLYAQDPADAPVTRTITLRVYDDSAGTDSPGTPLYFNDFMLTSSTSAIQEIATTDMAVTVPQQFRVGVEFKDAGLPSITRDNDGTIAPDKNFIFAIPGGWIRSQQAGLQGDWIMRAFVSGAGSGGNDSGTPVGDSCTSNPDCPTGQFCDTSAGSCTFECRVDDDCGGGICNSLGQCVGGSEAGGCCRAERGGGTGTAVLGLGILGVLVARRRVRNREVSVPRSGS